MFGALGGFILPKTFGWLARETGSPQAAFLALLALTIASLVWLHWVVIVQRVRDMQALLAQQSSTAAAGATAADA
jgi:NNP family nitrate/nitrite transporter-like MFS transporter